MPTPTDISVSTTIAQTARLSSGDVTGATGGQSFEREVFRALERIHSWEHCAGPDHFDMALDLVGKTGTHYEFDGAFLTHETLYVIEAKKVNTLTRQHIGIFVYKLLDILLASRELLTTIAIKPVLVSAGPRVSAAAWLHATAWGILLVSPQRPTPLEVLATLESHITSPELANLRDECEQLADRLWRPVDRLVYPPKPGSLIYHIATDQVLGRDACQHLMDVWQQSVARTPGGVY